MKINFTCALILTAMITSCLMVNNSFAQTHKKTTPAVKPATKKAPVVAAAPKPSAADIEQGQALLSKADCLACHKVDVKVVGPAYKDVSAKYPANEASYTLLTKKVISGGSGVWGTVPMAPHPALAAADVRKMIEYILTINK